MHNIQLKDYQQKTLDSLRLFLTEARFKGPMDAYREIEKSGVVNNRQYKALPNAEEVPFVCLRLPTGGGKTLLAAHAVRIAAEVYLERDYPLALWLVPSNTIRQQTLETLTKPGHPNYEVLNKAFGGNFMVIDITDFTSLRPHDLVSKAIVVVGTVQTIKTEEANTDSRKVYAHNEHLEPLFTKIPAEFIGYDLINQGENKGKVRFSFVNLLRMHRPLVLVDEAHNNSTTLGLDLFKRINAACVIEFTATPAQNSNILHSVSATALKAEEMIKLPIVLTEHQTWDAAVRDSILTRKRLETYCQDENLYIRPIVLFQAEQQGQEITWQVLKKHLIETENIPEMKIAVVTGDQRELDGIDLFDSSCPIDYVITVQALKEGWDCSFAYVFCSVANIKSAKDVEQILGRVLRMPYAKRRKHEDLNRAYAHVSSTSWPNAVLQLHDRLVEHMGFEEQEAEQNIETSQPPLFDSTTGELFKVPAPFILELKKGVDISDITDDEKQCIEISPAADGSTIVKVTGSLSYESITKLASKVPPESQGEVRLKLQMHQAALSRAVAPVSRGDRFLVPQLMLRLQGELEPPDEEAFLNAGNWRLSGPAELSENEFSLHPDGKTFSIDIEDGHIRYSVLPQNAQMNLDLVEAGWTVNRLSDWLDRRLRQPDIAQPQMLEFIRRTLIWLEERRGIPLTALARGRFLLQKVLEVKIKKAREEAKKRGYQTLLFDNHHVAEVSDDNCFSYRPEGYNPSRQYRGKFSPKKHYYPVIGDMNGEEADCAKAIEMQGGNVKFWVRNLERDKEAFRLPTSTDYFYPDFVVQLNDGRILVLEYKGDFLKGQDTAEKENIGLRWASLSKGKAVFLMAWKKNDQGKDLYQQIAEAIR